MEIPAAWLVAAGPLALIALAILPGANRSPAAVSRAATWIAGGTLVSALVAAVALLASGGPISTPTLGVDGIGLGVWLDAVSATMLALVSFVGLIVLAYSRNYLDGNPRQGVFVQGLALTLAAVLIVIVSGNLAQLFVAWVLTSLGLDRLLKFYPNRPAAVLAARKKFVFSRVGDLCLLAAMVLIWRAFGSLDYAVVFEGAKALAGGAVPGEMHAVAALLAVCAVLKSAQFPAHGWLTEVMETPTPVSALLHAGLINAGGFLLIRFADVMALSAPALAVLAVIGAVTALVGSVVMLTQPSVKVQLAWSTIAQMGFMTLQCGLGAFAAALLHVVAHSLYKAHAFLSSGSVVDMARASWSSTAGKARPRYAVLVAIGVALVATWAASLPFGSGPLEKPGAFVLGAVLAMGLTQLVLGGFGGAAVLIRAASAAGVVALAWFALQAVAERLTAGVLPEAVARGPFDAVLAGLFVLAFAAATYLQNRLPALAQSPAWRRLHTHVANGFYVNTWANRLAIRLWPSPPPAPGAQAAPLQP